MRRIRTGRALAMAALLQLGVPALARATDAGTDSTLLARGAAPNGIAVGNRGATEVIVREVTIAPGGSTGWHYHPGEVVAVVKSGTLTRTLYDCSTEVTTAGTAIVEPGGLAHGHNGRNLGTEPVVLVATYVLPAGQPLSQDIPPPPHCRP
jgi:quercetin dioxygenase-like cupin family protein